MTYNGLMYRQAGADVEAADALIRRIAPAAGTTRRPGTDAELGGFGGLFDLKVAGYSDPILPASTDGVGTKLKLAIEAGDFSTIGRDLVAMCVNDIVVQGAEPLVFLDYYATGNLAVENAAIVIEGIAHACHDCRCALIGGETAEMPGMYAPGDFDLAGFAVGAVERNNVLSRPGAMCAGHVLIGVSSSGLHANGFSLARRVLGDLGHSLDAPMPFAENATIAHVLLRPTRLYVKSALTATRSGRVKGFAYITGGGITEDLPRIIPSHLLAEIDLAAWTTPAVFDWLSGTGGITDREMLRTFNCGIGLIAAIDEESAADCIASFAEAGDQAPVIAFLTSASGNNHTDDSRANCGNPLIAAAVAGTIRLIPSTSGNCRVRYRGTGLFA